MTTAADVYAFGGLVLAVISGKSPLSQKRNHAARTFAVCVHEITRPADHPLLPEPDYLRSLHNESRSTDPEACQSMIPLPSSLLS